MIKFFNGIRFRIMLAVSAVLIVMFAAIGILVLSKTETSLVAAFDRSLKSRAEYLISRVSINPMILPIAAPGEEISITYQDYEDETELYRSVGFPDSAIIGKDSLENFRMVSVENEDIDNADSRISLTLAFPATELENDLYNLQMLFIAGLILSVVVVFFAGYFVSAWLLKPVKNISQMAKNIVSADTIQSLPLPNSRDELRELTETINGMLQRIKDNAELQKNFFASAAHELRTPLAIMKTGIEVSIDNPNIAEEIKTYFSGQLDDINRISRLLEDFLLISRSGSQQAIVKEKVELSTFVSEAVARIKRIAVDYKTDINFVVTFNGNHTIEVDSVKLEHILLNLLENAVKYAVPDTIIECAIGQTEKGRYFFTVFNRTGQEEGEVITLLHAFYQGNPFKEGHGLGLWISNRLTTMIGGTLEIEWKNFGFKVRLEM